MTTTAISAPGKVLLAGGYLVLDREHTGLVFGLDARIHVHVQDLPTPPDSTSPEIIVRSPQFIDAEWRYGYRQTEEDGGVKVTQLKGTTPSQPNKFVQTALSYALSYITSSSPTNFHPTLITILADTDYYSHNPSPQPPLPSPSPSPSTPPRFISFSTPLHQAHKTGLGSSAALVTAFTTALTTHYLHLTPHTLSTPTTKSHLHNLSQAAHCAAQGKIGSGFDVAAAVYGSCIYRRFSPSILSELGEIGDHGFARRLRELVQDEGKKWDTQIEKSAAVMPRGIRLLMCDVDCGSETVGLVKRVLAWRKENADEAGLLWATLQRGNEDLAGELARLALECGGGGAEDGEGDGRYDNLKNIILTIRSLIREMSSSANVPIEPRVQTDLLNTCSRVPGVIGGVVPGAGGYDAIALLVRDDEAVIRDLHSLLDGYRGEAREGEGDGAGIGKVRLLGVRQEMEGVKVEETGLYGGWVG